MNNKNNKNNAQSTLSSTENFNNFKKNNHLRVKRGNDETLVEATAKGDYSHWLTLDDLIEIVRIMHNSYAKVTDNKKFEILASIADLNHTLEAFILKTKDLAESKLTLIIQLTNLRWVTLVIHSKDKNYIAYYTDSKNIPLPYEYFQLLFEKFKIQTLSLSPGLQQQTEDYNCGLWALENAKQMNQMLDENKSIYWLSKQLQISHSKEYFINKRQSLSEYLRTNAGWRERHPKYKSQSNLHSDPQPSSSFTHISPADSIVENPKRLKLMSNEEQEKITTLLEVFVESFMCTFSKDLGKYYLLAKGERLTEASIKNELKVGLTGALLGASVSQSLTGTIPSLVASIRMISGQYYPSKDKSQKITKFFSEVEPGSLSMLLSAAAVDIFYGYENQFMTVTDKAGDRIAMEKLAEDAVSRVFNFIAKHSEINCVFSDELITQGVLQGSSEKFFDPSVKPARLRISGYNLQDKKNGDKVNTANLYEKVGLVVFDAQGQPNKYYSNKQHPSHRYGYRRLLNWEQDVNGELKDSLKEQFSQEQFPQEESVHQYISRKYDYLLNVEEKSKDTQRILAKIERRHSTQNFNRQTEPNKMPVLFDLRKPIQNFSGRIELLKTLHNNLLAERTMAIVPHLAGLDLSESMASSSSTSSSSGSAFSISGLGGIGKTQLALRYAELYAHEYDFNVLWISAETQENLSYSFNRLANKLQIVTSDSYGNKKDLEAIIDAVYEYFSDRKSLFIFDNVENYRAIESYLPKTMLGNKPTLLITSRYNNWKNVAFVLSLGVFTENEAEELIRKSLNLSDDSESIRIKELNQLLQGLPLALQQALAYIKLRKNTDVNFSLNSYINLYKEKCQQLLNFDFSNFNNDPYAHTVYTTWLITFEKINSSPLGQDALEALYIMAYLDPENITFSKFYFLNHINRDLKRFYDLESIMQLLINYSIISYGHEKKFTIHRLVQQVIRLNLEQDKPKLEQVIRKTQNLLVHFGIKGDQENIFHYLHFLLYITEHNDIKSTFLYGHPEKLFFDSLTHQHLKYCAYFNDLAYLKFSKERYLKFIGNAMAYYIKLGLLHFLNETFNYLEKKLHEGILSKQNIKFIIEFYNNIKDCKFKLKRYSSLPQKKELQQESLKFLYEFKIKIFGNSFIGYENCPAHSLKRSICSFETDQDKIEDIKNLKIKSHLKKVAGVTRIISSGLMAKDILAALLKGDFSEVAINFGLIASSTLLGKISNKLLTEGKSLAADSSLLEKDLGLESKTALGILYNKEVLSVGKRQFLGKTIQAASPFVARATSIFFVYNLKNEIQAYAMGDKTILPNIISNGVIVGVDGLEAGIEGAELFEVIAGVAEFTGPVGEVITLLAWLGSELYTSEQQLKTINKYASLSMREEIVQFFRALIHMSPSEYLQLKAKNEQLVKHVILFLKAHPDINSYILPTYYKENVLYNNSRVFLNKQRNLEFDESMPNQPKEGHLFCLSGTIKLNLSNVNSNCGCSYFCHHAIGVEYLVNRTGNATLVALGPGNQEVFAFIDSPTLFIVENGRKQYFGSNKINVFHLQGNSITGLLSGGSESNILNLDKFFPEKSDYLLIDEDRFLCGKNSSVLNYIPLFCADDNRVELNNINQIRGRNNQQEIFYVSKNVREIDGGGGRNNEYPDTFFLNARSYKSPSFILRNNTLILFLLDSSVDSVDYLIPLKEVGVAQVQFHSQQSIQHRFFFQTAIQNIQALNIKNSTITILLNILGFEDSKTFTLNISNSSVVSINNQTRNTLNLARDISYLFQDTEMKLLNNGQVYLQEKISNNKTIAENINLFTELANRLEKTFSFQLFNNSTISIGRTKHEVFYINGLFESHLVGNGGENVYIVLPNKEPKFPLAPITLYDTFKEDYSELTEIRDTLDLRELVKKYKQIYPNAIIFPQVTRVAENLFLTLINAIYSSSHYLQDLEGFHSLVTIQLKNAVLDNYTWYQNIDIFIDNSIPKHIGILENDEIEVWNLQEAPLVFTDDKQIIVITNNDIGEKTEIIIQKNIGNFTFLHNEKNLILTNILTASSEVCTIILVDYKIAEMKEKILSATLQFFDQELKLQDYQVKIENASYFDFVESENINDQITSSANLMSTTVASVNHKLSPQGILHNRPRRQVHTKLETVAINLEKSIFKHVNKLINPSFFTQNRPKLSNRFDEDRILMIADDYLKHQDFASKNAASRVKKRLNQRSSEGQASPMLSAQHSLKSSIKSRTENLAMNKNTLKSSFKSYFPQSKPKLSNRFDEYGILRIADDYSNKHQNSSSKNTAQPVKKRINQRDSDRQAISIAAQNKKSNSNLEKKPLIYTKINRNYDKQITPKQSTHHTLKSPVKSQTENLSENKNKFFNSTFLQEKTSFTARAASNFLNPKEVFKDSVTQPRLGYQQSESKSQYKPNTTGLSRVDASSDFNQTLFFFQLLTGQPSQNSTFAAKFNKMYKKSENPRYQMKFNKPTCP